MSGRDDGGADFLRLFQGPERFRIGRRPQTIEVTLPELIRDLPPALNGPPAADRFNRAASHVDGAWSILIGIAANKSFAIGQPVAIRSCVDFG
tara:strand:- start:945 stop:1223 length:279 start_codon:yes stop_codon:yes gene_type:complete